MERYLVFAGDLYYPAGGWEDFIGSFRTLAEVKEVTKDYMTEMTWHHTYDMQTGALIEKFYGGVRE
jgi:hypothetical protein